MALPRTCWRAFDASGILFPKEEQIIAFRAIISKKLAI